MKHSKVKLIIPLRKALLWIFGSIVIISGSSYAGLLYYKNFREKQKQDPFYNIVAITQNTSEISRLPTACLAEYLQLSMDQPTNLFCFNIKEAEQKLQSVPIIKKAHIKKLQPGTIQIDYVIRKPVALLADYTNTALDSEGLIFPVKPFFTCRGLPEIYLGIIDSEDPQWGEPLNGVRIELALTLTKLLENKLNQPMINIRSVDVSKAFSASCGQRQIVVVLDEFFHKKKKLQRQQRILRLPVEGYENQINNYLVLQKHLGDAKASNEISKSLVIDLRIANLAFIVGKT